jgi:hypothetical protein
MKDRILKGWTFQRVLYLLMGVMIIIQFAAEKQWFGILLGVYFAAMGFFAFGCAAGNCFGSKVKNDPLQKSKLNFPNVEFEEIKIKTK